tara:strand:- start:1194 stop:1610 length:417 start_codon:yes stop_codon:yes gene_type:complete
MKSIAEEFSGKEFTSEELFEFVTSGTNCVGTGLVEQVKGKKEKQVKKAPKKIKMTVRQYFMTQETDLYKVRITKRVEEHKQFNKENESEIDSGDVESKPENFLKVMKLIMDDLTDEDKEELKEKVEKYIEEHTESDSE